MANPFNPSSQPQHRLWDVCSTRIPASTKPEDLLEEIIETVVDEMKEIDHPDVIKRILHHRV